MVNHLFLFNMTGMREVIVFAGLVCVGLILWLILRQEKQPRYRRKAMLTGRERDFFYHLWQALPECLVYPQVPVSALIEPLGIGKTRQTALARIAGKRVSYAVFDEDMALIAVVELDHRSRPGRSEAAKEAYLASAQIKTIRFQARHMPSATKIRASIFPLAESLPEHRAASNILAQTGRIEFDQPGRAWRNTFDDPR